MANDVTGVLPSANLDADTAHLSGTQTFSGAKTFSATLAATGDANIGERPDPMGGSPATTITALGGFDSHLWAFADSTYDLGSSDLYWRKAYIDEVNTTGNINAGGMI